MQQRVEIITGRERRRRWTGDEKRALLMEAFAPGATVAQVARRHGVAESCLYTWRKQVLDAARDRSEPGPAVLVPVVVEPAAAAGTAPARSERSPAGYAVVRFPDGTRVKVTAGYSAAALKALIAALRPAR